MKTTDLQDRVGTIVGVRREVTTWTGETRTTIHPARLLGVTETGAQVWFGTVVANLGETAHARRTSLVPLADIEGPFDISEYGYSTLTDRKYDAVPFI